MSLSLHDYELNKFGSSDNIKTIVTGNDPDYVLKHSYQSKDTGQLHCLIKSLPNWGAEPSRTENYYLIMYKHASPSALAMDRDYRKAEYQIQKLTKNQFTIKKLLYRFSSEFTS